MLKKPLMATATLAAAAALMWGGVAQAQSGSAGGGYGSTMDSGTGVYPAPSGAPGTYPGAGASGNGANGAAAGTANGAGMETAGPQRMGASGMEPYGGPSARGVDPGVYPLISNDSLYPDPRAGMPTGARQRRGAW